MNNDDSGAEILVLLIMIGICFFPTFLILINQKKTQDRENECISYGGMYKYDGRGSDECWSSDGTRILKFYEN